MLLSHGMKLFQASYPRRRLALQGGPLPGGPLSSALPLPPPSSLGIGPLPPVSVPLTPELSPTACCGICLIRGELSHLAGPEGETQAPCVWSSSHAAIPLFSFYSEWSQG